jgi:hypothetical protein
MQERRAGGGGSRVSLTWLRKLRSEQRHIHAGGGLRPDRFDQPYGAPGLDRPNAITGLSVVAWPWLSIGHSGGSCLATAVVVLARPLGMR